MLERAGGPGVQAPAAVVCRQAFTFSQVRSHHRFLRMKGVMSVIMPRQQAQIRTNWDVWPGLYIVKML